MIRDTSPDPLGKAEHRASSIDVHVGGRVRLRRTMLGLSQEKLAEGLGLTFQQVQKYERGMNRIGASRLFQLAGLLDVPVGFFFDALPQSMSGHGGGSEASLREAGEAQQSEAGGDDVLQRRETLEMVRAYYRITDPAVRKRLLDLIKSLRAAD
jgi:transcriptional regulator with XRE-family HTH domain